MGTKKQFTFIELMMTVLLIAVISSIVGGNLQFMKKINEENRLTTNLASHLESARLLALEQKESVHVTLKKDRVVVSSESKGVLKESLYERGMTLHSSELKNSTVTFTRDGSPSYGGTVTFIHSKTLKTLRLNINETTGSVER